MKKTLALLLTLTMLFTMVLPAGAFSFETVESVSTELPAEEVTSETESAALAAEVIPGKKLIYRHDRPSHLRRRDPGGHLHSA